MSYASNDIASPKYLAANVIYQATNGLLRPDTGDEADRGILDDAVMMLDVISSYWSEDDPKYTVEMQAVRDDRLQALKALKTGEQLGESTTEAYRWRELKAMFRSLCRQGQFVRQESPEATWTPQVKKER